jgi:uncharacterized membrane protein (DUF106 family)
MKAIFIIIITVFTLSITVFTGCDNKNQLLQERLKRTEKQLDEVRANLEKAGKETDRIPELLIKIKQAQDESRVKRNENG